MAKKPSKSDTKEWTRSAADEHAVANGCYFDAEAARHVRLFAEQFCRHSKGEWAGQPFTLLEWQWEDIVAPLFGWMRQDGTRRFRSAYIELPKKNGKSSLASMIGLYMLVGDGEPGAEVYSAATDQQQASIVHGEAVNMVEASPELQAILSINRTTKNIAFPATNSYYRALSAEAEGKEGLNAHAIIIDELHVWAGRKLWDALKYAFAARRQGLRFVITTAGVDPLSVCREQHDYAATVISGATLDDRFLAVIRAADPDDDWREPATWHKANPSLGSTIRVDDFAADVEEAKKTLTSQASLKRYRLNIWGGGDNPWLNMDDWVACRAEFGLPDLEDRQCWLGLDLGRTDDMTAAVFAFPHETGYRLWPIFWLPEEVVTDHSSPEYYRAWAQQGLLRTTPGNTCDYRRVTADLVDLVRQFRVQAVHYDPAYADQMTADLEDATGVVRAPFAQTMANFAGPSAEFERAILAHECWHPGNAILDWQAGHVQVRQDTNANKRPVKPSEKDSRKIDGIVAAVMAVAGAMTARRGQSVYEERDIFVL